MREVKVLNDSKYEKLLKNDKLLRKIVYSIDKAIGEDLSQYLREHHRETNNAIVQLRGDFINDNLRHHVVDENTELIPFQRSGWSGRIIIDRLNRTTYTVTTVSTLSAIPKKKERTKPHYLQSVLAIENKECKGTPKQITLFECGMTAFDTQFLEQDFNSINQGLINVDENYVHYIIAYKAEHGEIKDIDLKLLDKDFDTVDETSLNEYIKPDFARLTDVGPAEQSNEIEENTDSKKLVAIKAGLKPNLKVVEKREQA